MSDLDRLDFGRALPAVRGTADWDDVLDRAAGLRSSRRRRLVVLFASALVVAVGAASAFGLRALVTDDRGSAGLPPEGVIPSAPTTGLLVLRYEGRPERSGRPGHFSPVHQVWVYADGRVIWRREGGPYGVGGISTGLVERRLTPEGVALLRGRVVGSGLFDRNRSLGSVHGLVIGSLRVRRGDRLVGVDWCCLVGSGFPPSYVIRDPLATVTQARTLRALAGLLANPAAELPATAWVDARPRAYVPSRYALCYWGGPTYWAALHPSRAISVLPRDAVRLLRGRQQRYRPDAPLAVDGRSGVVCSEVATRNVVALDAMLRRGGFRPDVELGPSWTYVLRAAKVNRTLWQISFEPILPHGQWEGMGG